MRLFTAIMLLISPNCFSQMPARIDSVIHKKGNTFLVRATLTDNDSTVVFPVRFMGMGKPKTPTGRTGMYYPNRTTRRKVYFIPDKTKM